MARLNEQLSAQNQSIEEHVASVQQAELARSVAMGQMATLRTKLQEESQRADELERHLAVKEKLLERTTHVKIRLGER